MSTQHRYWYYANIPSIGIRYEQGWCFGTDALAAARDAIKVIATKTKQAEFLNANDVHLNHCSACSCIPAEFRA